MKTPPPEPGTKVEYRDPHMSIPSPNQREAGSTVRIVLLSAVSSLDASEIHESLQGDVSTAIYGDMLRCERVSLV